MATVNLINVKKSYGDEVVLHDISLSLDKGDFMVVVGPSGCGKSSLLRMIAGLDTVSAGQITLNGECINHLAPAKRDIAMVFQNYALYPHMSVFDNMAYGLKMRKTPKDDIKLKVAEVAKTLQLTSFLTRKPSELSGGQRQRVAMGRAIVRQPAVFLFDEPLSNLDAKLRSEMRLEIKKLQKQLGITSLYVTHDQTEAMTMGDKIVVLNKGHIEQLASPDDVYHKPASLFVAGFMGNSAINFLPATVLADGLHAASSLGFSLRLPHVLKAGQELVLAIRPEHLSCVDESKAKFCIHHELTEVLGADKMIYGLTDGGARVSIRIDYDSSQGRDGCLFIDFDSSKLNVFDKLTGRRIGD